MELFVDTADVELIARAAERYPIDGFTTNPRILASCSQAKGIGGEFKRLVDRKGLRIFAQVTADEADGMVEQASELKRRFGERFVVKIPATEQGYRAVMRCADLGIPTCVTVVHSVWQAALAAKAGAEYVAPYVSHIEADGADARSCISAMVEFFERNGYGAKVLGASFRTVGQVTDTIAAGAQAVTVKPEMLDMLIEHPSTASSMRAFEQAWSDAFGERNVCDILSCDL